MSRSSLLLALVLAACSKQAQETPATLASEGTPAPKVAAAAEPSAAAPGVARHEEQSTELYEFEYGYPAAVGAIPKLKAELDADLAKQKADLIVSAKEQQADSKKQGFPYNPLGNWTAWKVVTDLPGWLSLSADLSDYSGGAHPNHGFSSLVWDRKADRRREPIDLFTSKEALSRAIRQNFCAALNKQRAEKRGEPVKAGSTDEFDQCIDPVASTVILGSSNRSSFDRIGILVGPYEAGPYVEGDYEVTLPITDAVLAAVKPEFRWAFAVKR
ncbi:DUF3298 and DUF4163 domain-containing protein [Novosphingobium sp. G106]|nr:DUF3298 and DUF4163 domain-containing protein [Novosphingobium sp. G106]